jgi:hypothetical protein
VCETSGLALWEELKLLCALDKGWMKMCAPLIRIKQAGTLEGITQLKRCDSEYGRGSTIRKVMCRRLHCVCQMNSIGVGGNTNIT